MEGVMVLRIPIPMKGKGERKPPLIEGRREKEKGRSYKQGRKPLRDRRQLFCSFQAFGIAQNLTWTKRKPQDVSPREERGEERINATSP
jgi:hypothetical protein